MLTRIPFPFRRYALVPLAVAAALLFRWSIWPALGSEMPFLLLWPAVMFCAWYGGLGPGILATLLSGLATAREYETAPPAKKIKPPTEAWTAKIEQLAPAKPTAEPKAKRRVLLFSVATGYYHTVIPHTDVAVKVLGKKSGAFEVTQSDDIEMFRPENLAGFDAVIINNTCSNGKRRNLFLDVLDGIRPDKGPGRMSQKQERRAQQQDGFPHAAKLADPHLTG